MGLLSENDKVELQDALIASKTRLTTKNAKQFGKLNACIYMLKMHTTEFCNIEDLKEKIIEIENLVEDIWEDLNGIDYV